MHKENVNIHKYIMEEIAPHQYTSTTICCSIQYILSLTTCVVRIYRVAKSLVNVVHGIQPFNRKNDFLILVDFNILNMQAYAIVDEENNLLLINITQMRDH
jgi:hypothetical protein